MPARSRIRFVADFDKGAGDPRGRGVELLREVEMVSGRIGLVITDDDSRVGAQGFDERPRHARVLVPEHTNVPGPRATVQPGREAVDGREDRRGACAPDAFEDARNGLVIGREQSLGAARGLRRLESEVARDDRAVADLQDGRLGSDLAVAVDDEARIAAEHGRSIEALRKPARHLRGADVPPDMALEIPRGEPEIAQGLGHRMGGVVAGEHQRCAARRIDDAIGGRLVLRQQRRMPLS